MKTLRVLSALSGPFGLAPFLAAQATGSLPPIPPSISDEVVTVPEFQVTETRQRDAWFASQAMSGTRAAASVLELPYQVQVLTQEFLEDFQLISLSEQMAFFPSYGSSADQADAAIGATSTGRMLRGFDQTVIRDGFRRTPPPTVGNTAQVEVIKGPISTLYGDASPGGLINYISKRPTARPTFSLSLSGGSYDFFRSNLTASGPLYRNKVFYLVSVENYYRKGEVQFTYARNGDYVIGLMFKPTASTTRGDDACTTFSAGLNLRLRGDALVAFANRSSSFNTNVTADRNLGTTIPNERGRGWEAGVKSLALQQRLGLTLSAFEIEKTNIGQTNPDFVLGGTMPEFIGSGRERARGVDGDFSWKVDEQLSLLTGGGYVEANVVDSTNAALRGTRKIYVPRHTGSLAARYKPAGRVKGLSLGWSFRYTGGFVRANATASRRYEEGAPRQIHSAFASYTWRQQRLRHTVQLNANNLFDKFYVGPDLYVGLGRQINLTDTVALK